MLVGVVYVDIILFIDCPRQRWCRWADMHLLLLNTTATGTQQKGAVFTIIIKLPR